MEKVTADTPVTTGTGGADTPVATDSGGADNPVATDTGGADTPTAIDTRGADTHVTLKGVCVCVCAGRGLMGATIRSRDQAPHHHYLDHYLSH